MEMNPFFNLHPEKFFAEYYVNTFKSQEHIERDSKMETDGADDHGFESLITVYRDYVHPANKFRNKTALIHFLKHISHGLCIRVRHERAILNDKPDFKYKYLFLSKQDISKFMAILKPIIECALQGENSLDKLSIALKNFVTVDCDSILSLFLFDKFQELEGLTKSKFIPVLKSVVPGVLMNSQTDSDYKFKFIENVIVYLLNEGKSYDVTVLKDLLAIFDSIWTILPVLPKTWGPEIVEATSKSGDYAKYMRAMTKKRIQEYQFYKLYESIEEYATEYFKMLEAIMNLGIPVKENLVKSFWFLLNAMPNETAASLVRGLIDSANTDHAKGVIGLIVGNVSAKNDEFANQIVSETLSKLIVEENGTQALAFSNYVIIDYHISILQISLYHSKYAVAQNIEKVMTLLKLLAKVEDNSGTVSASNPGEKKSHGKNEANLVKSIVKAFATLVLLPKETQQKEAWKDKEFQSKFWAHLGKLDEATNGFDYEFSEITQENVKTVIDILSNHLVPWLKEFSSTAKSKTEIKKIVQILAQTHLSFSSLLPSKNSNQEKDFTSYYYNKIGAEKNLVESLLKIETEIFEIAECLNEKVAKNEILLRNDAIIQHLGSVYKQMITSNHLALKDATFHENKGMFSMLVPKHIKELDTSLLKQLGNVMVSLTKFGGSDIDSEDKQAATCVSRLYEYEHHYGNIPKVQDQNNALAEPRFIQFFDKFETKHTEKLDDLKQTILVQFMEVISKSELEVVLRDKLVGNLILLDKLINPKVLKDKEALIGILISIFSGSGIKDEKVNKQIWNVCMRVVMMAKRWRQIKQYYQPGSDDLFTSSSSFAKFNEMREQLKSDIEACQKKLKESLDDQASTANSIIDAILRFDSEDISSLKQQEIRKLGTIEIWLSNLRNNDEYLAKISNYITSKLPVMPAILRNKALSLLRKTIEARIKLNNFKSEEVKLEGSHSGKVESYDRYLPSIETRPYIDSIDVGFNESVTTIVKYEDTVPFSKLSDGAQDGDVLFKSLILDDQNFIKTLFKQLLDELCLAQDAEDRKEGGGSKHHLKAKAMHLISKLQGANKDDENKDKNKPKIDKSLASKISSVVLSGVNVRYSRVFYAVFKFYGSDVFKAEFLPVIQEYVNAGFKDIQHPHVIKAFLVDVITSFLRTCKYYQESNQDLYHDCLQLLLDMFDENEEVEKNSYFMAALKDAFVNRDPKRLEKFILATIDDLSLQSGTKAKNILGFMKYLQIAFGWKFLPYSSKLIEKILKEDTEQLPMQKNLLAVVAPVHKLLLYKYWNLVSDVFAIHTTTSSKAAPSIEDSVAISIFSYFKEVVDSLSQLEDDENNILLVNNCVQNILRFYRGAFKSKMIGSLPVCFNNLAMDISFLSVERQLQKSTGDDAKKLEILHSGDLYAGNHYNSERIKSTIEYIGQHKDSSNWRIRENYLFILQGLNSVLVRKASLNQLKSYLDLILPSAFYDEDVYVRKMARLCLKTILEVNQDKVDEIVSKFKDQISDDLKAVKGQGKDADKEIMQRLLGDLNILLSAAYSCNYSIPDYLPQL